MRIGNTVGLGCGYKTGNGFNLLNSNIGQWPKKTSCVVKRLMNDPKLNQNGNKIIDLHEEMLLLFQSKSSQNTKMSRTPHLVLNNLIVD